MKIVSKTTLLITALIIFSGFRIYKTLNLSILPDDFRVVKKWQLPAILKEVSGIATISNTQFACIQDESGSIFIYNLETSAIEKEIPFASAGDYEDVSIVNSDAWVLRSDGKLFEVSNFESKKMAVKEYATPLTSSQNVEGMCYDKINNRLLLVIKNGEATGKNYKGIYSFDLATKTAAPQPVFKINSLQEIKSGTKKRTVEIMPSGIAIHPQTKDMYVTDARNSLLLILDTAGIFKSINTLESKQFHQAEGITFDNNGGLFISNEASKGGGNILKVEVIN